MSRRPVAWTVEMDAALRAMRAKGYGYERAGDLIGVSNSTARDRVMRLELPTWGQGGMHGSRGDRQRIAARIDEVSR